MRPHLHHDGVRLHGVIELENGEIRAVRGCREAGRIRITGAYPLAADHRSLDCGCPDHRKACPNCGNLIEAAA